MSSVYQDFGIRLPEDVAEYPLKLLLFQKPAKNLLAPGQEHLLFPVRTFGLLKTENVFSLRLTYCPQPSRPPSLNQKCNYQNYLCECCSLMNQP